MMLMLLAAELSHAAEERHVTYYAMLFASFAAADAITLKELVYRAEDMYFQPMR